MEIRQGAFVGGGYSFRRGNSWILSWRAFDPEGKYYRGESEHIRVDANTFTWQMKNLSANFQEVKDAPKLSRYRILRNRTSREREDLLVLEQNRELARRTRQGRC